MKLIVHKFFPKNEEETLPKAFCEVSITPDTKEKDIKKKTSGQYSLWT